MRFMKLFSLVFICLVQLNAQIECHTGFIHAHGHKLCLDGQEYRQIGFNKLDLFWQYLEGGEQKQLAQKALRDLSEHGFKLIRVNASPFYPADFNRLFFDDDPFKYVYKQNEYFRSLQSMIDDCRTLGIKIILVLFWNPENLADLGHNSLREGVVSIRSAGYDKMQRFILPLARYVQNQRTVAMLQIANEWDLYSNILSPGGILKVRPGMNCKKHDDGTRVCQGDHLSQGPIVRDTRNNFTASELSVMFQRVAIDVRRANPNHLISSGHASSRKAALTLHEHASLGTVPPCLKFEPVGPNFKFINNCWEDTEAKQKKYLNMIHLGIDVMTIHPYKDFYKIKLYSKFAHEIGKPLMVEEIGPDTTIKPNDLTYTSRRNLRHIKKTIDMFIESDAAVLLFWTYGDDREFNKDNKDFLLRYGQTDEALDIIENANKKLQASLVNDTLSRRNLKPR